MIQLPKHILAFGHRKQHGKDTCCDFLEEYFTENGISYTRTAFAKSLKEQTAEKYNLDVSLMESEYYKNSSPKNLKGKTVRQVLIEYGLAERAKEPLVFCRAAYTECFESGSDFCFMSDFRFPNEGETCDEILEGYLKERNITDQTQVPQVHKILVHRPDGRFVSDGADDQLPDVSDYWDYVIMNDDKTDNWKETLRSKLLSYVSKLTEIKSNAF